ncbi:LysR family transcriptional regulator [Nonomuraea sp. NN258]|nr:LysR family transcriptional regulator [Nonomuraea antri]
MDLEIRHLRAVCALADTGSVTKAAAMLGLSQPALTAQLQRIEREIGATLFTRSPQGVAPTRLGGFVISHARATLLGLEELRRGVSRRSRAAAEVISLGGVVSAISVGLAERLTEHLPGTEVRLRMDYSPQLLWELVSAGRLDAVATVDYPGYEVLPSAEVACEVVTVEPVFVALPASDPLAVRDEIELADLADRWWVMTPSDGAGWPECFYAACEQAGFAPRVRYTVQCGDPIRELVAAHGVVSPCQPTFTVVDGLVVRPLSGTPASMRHIVACNRTGPLGGRMPDLLDLTRDSYWSCALQRPRYVDWLRRNSAAPPVTDPAE